MDPYRDGRWCLPPGAPPWVTARARDFLSALEDAFELDLHEMGPMHEDHLIRQAFRYPDDPGRWLADLWALNSWA